MPKVQPSLTTLWQKEKLSEIKGKLKVIRTLQVNYRIFYMQKLMSYKGKYVKN